MRKTIFIFCFLLAGKIFTQTTQFADVMNYYNAEKNFNGVTLIATAGHIDYLNGIGLSNRQSGTTINSKSKFKIASITKTFTAVLILQLMEAGKLELNATIGKYLPEYVGEAKNKVTIENLITYSSGIPNCESYIGEDIYKKQITTDSFISKYAGGKLESVPGEKFNYDNGDYIILGKIIEKITGKTFEQNLNEKILKPLDMSNTSMLYNKDIIRGLVQCYIYDDSTKVFNSDEPYFIENYFAAGAMYSTVEDLLKFDQGIFNYILLKKQTVDLMLTPHKNLGDVGLGFWFSSGYGALNTKFVYRPGGIYGATANWIHVLDSNRTIIVFSNTNATNLFEMSQQLNAVATGQKISIPKTTQAERQNNFDLEKVRGTWLLDLRPGPNSEAYLKDFILTPTIGKAFSGEFYGTGFTSGKFCTDWEFLYFAFSTSDKENVYYHSGYIDGNKISGISYSPDRKFISHWTGVKK